MLRSAVGLSCAGVVAAGLSAQSFNVNFGAEFGTPSDSFGGVGLAGFWNGVEDDSLVPLFDLAGNATDVSFTLGRNFFTEPISTSSASPGDAGVLLSEYAVTSSSPAELTLAGLRGGEYRLIVYIASPFLSPSSTPHTVRPKNGVVGDPAEVTIQGLNISSFEEGVNYAEFGFTIEGGSFEFEIDNGGDAIINGFQLELIPAPTTAAAFLAALPAAARRRRNR